MATVRCSNNPNRRGLVQASVAKWIKQRDFYTNSPGKIINGEMFVLYDGKWIEAKRFKALFKAPVVVNFSRNLANPDGRNNYLNQ